MGKIKDKIAGKKTHKTFGETVGGRAFPDATETKLTDILNVQILVLDVAFKAMQFGEVAILLYTMPDSEKPEEKCSVLVGGEVVRRKVKEAQEKKLLPLLGTIVHDEVYYDIV